MRKYTKTGFLLRCLPIMAVALFVSQSAARADFVIDPTPPADQDLNFTTNQTNVNSFTGAAGGVTINITTDVLVDVASGNATITPATSGSPPVSTVFRSASFTPTYSGSDTKFTEFTFRGQVSADSTLRVTVDDNLGNSFTFNVDKSGDFTAIGVMAIAGTGEFITKVTVANITDNAQFDSLKQIDFGYDTAPDTRPHITPVPSSIVMLISMAVPGLGFFRYRRRKTPAGN
jgi:hypothetical protein